jgi:hypothetical protein
MVEQAANIIPNRCHNHFVPALPPLEMRKCLKRMWTRPSVKGPTTSGNAKAAPKESLRASAGQMEPMEDEEKVLAGRADANIPALLTKDVHGG